MKKHRCDISTHIVYYRSRINTWVIA